MGPMGPRGLGPIKQSCFKNLLVRVCRFPNDIFGFWVQKASLLALAGFQTTFWDFGRSKVEKVDLFDYMRNEAMLVLVFFVRLVFLNFRRKF